MCAIQDELVNATLAQISNIVTSNFTKKCCRCNTKNSRSAKRKRCLLLYKVGYFTHQLLREGLWPIPQDQTKLSVGAIDTALSSIELYREDDYCKIPFCGMNPRFDLEQLIPQLVSNTLDSQKGLCLACTKAGRYTKSSYCGLDSSVACASAPSDVEMVFEQSNVGR